MSAGGRAGSGDLDGAPPRLAAWAAAWEAERAFERARMVDEQVAARGVEDPWVLAAMSAVPRHRLVGEAHAARAYDDAPQPIGLGQTISQPYMVALMTEAARVRPGARVLEVGTGSGYQAAVLAALGAEVYTLERLPELAREAAARLAALGVRGVHLGEGDGALGWPEAAPFDAILVTCAPPRVPEALVEQLAPGGRLVIPVGPASEVQRLVALERGEDGLVRRRDLGAVRFVPLV